MSSHSSHAEIDAVMLSNVDLPRVAHVHDDACTGAAISRQRLRDPLRALRTRRGTYDAGTGLRELGGDGRTDAA